MAKKFYAVVKGHQPGIYKTWGGSGGAQAQVNGFPAARFRGFALEEEAVQWYRSQTDPTHIDPWEMADLDGYAIVVMLKPHGQSRNHIQLLGTGIYDEETEAQARQAALSEYWKPEHDLLGRPVVEVHMTPEPKVQISHPSSTSRDYNPDTDCEA